MFLDPFRDIGETSEIARDFRCSPNQPFREHKPVGFSSSNHPTEILRSGPWSKDHCSKTQRGSGGNLKKTENRNTYGAVLRDLADSVWRSVISSNTLPTFLHVLGFFEIPYRVETHWNTIFYPIGLAYRTEIVSSGVLFLMFWDTKSQNCESPRCHPEMTSG